MKMVNIIILLFIATSCYTQSDTLIISKELITDWSKYPIYSELVKDRGSRKVWKDEYKYLDNIDVYKITYLSEGLKINGILAQPKKEGKYPCIIYNRGGNREFGSLKAYHGAIMLGQMADQGYVVIASQYRGNGGSEGQEEFGGADINDVIILPEVLDEIEKADASNIGMYGWSRGGMMTYMALTKTDRIKAAAVGGAVSDLNAMIKDRPEMESAVLSELVPDYDKNKSAELKKRSAVNWAYMFPKDVPLLIMHGTSDWRVKSEQSLRLAMELEKYRVPYRLIIFEGADHGISEHEQEVDEQVMKWFDQYLKQNKPVPNMEYHGR